MFSPRPLGIRIWEGNQVNSGAINGALSLNSECNVQICNPAILISRTAATMSGLKIKGMYTLMLWVARKRKSGCQQCRFLLELLRELLGVAGSPGFSLARRVIPQNLPPSSPGICSPLCLCVSSSSLIKMPVAGFGTHANPV